MEVISDHMLYDARGSEASRSALFQALFPPTATSRYPHVLKCFQLHSVSFDILYIVFYLFIHLVFIIFTEFTS